MPKIKLPFQTSTNFNQDGLTSTEIAYNIIGTSAAILNIIALTCMVYFYYKQSNKRNLSTRLIIYLMVSYTIYSLCNLPGYLATDSQNNHIFCTIEGIVRQACISYCYLLGAIISYYLYNLNYLLKHWHHEQEKKIMILCTLYCAFISGLPLAFEGYQLNGRSCSLTTLENNWENIFYHTGFVFGPLWIWIFITWYFGIKTINKLKRDFRDTPKYSRRIYVAFGYPFIQSIAWIFPTISGYILLFGYHSTTLGILALIFQNPQSLWIFLFYFINQPEEFKNCFLNIFPKKKSSELTVNIPLKGTVSKVNFLNDTTESTNTNDYDKSIQNSIANLENISI